MALSTSKRECELSLSNWGNWPLKKGIPLGGFDSDWLLSEVIVAPCRQSPQAWPERAKCTVHGISSRELFVLKQHEEIPTGE
jgi:hypothetical protein